MSEMGETVTASRLDRENCPIDWNSFLLFSRYDVTCSLVPEAAWAAPWYEMPYLNGGSWHSTFIHSVAVETK